MVTRSTTLRMVACGWLAACAGDPKTTDETDEPGETDLDTEVPGDLVRGDYIGCVDEVPVVEEVDGRWRAETTHYRLWLDASVIDQQEATTLALLAEASWGAWETWFGEAPATEGPFELVLTRDLASFRVAISDDGDTAPDGAAGYFSYSSGRAYLYQQPTVYYTRVLALHELTHQFHEGVRASEGDLPFWYGEGVAEHLGLHDWDGRCASLGVRPLATQEDPWAQSLEELRTAELPDWVAGDAFPSRASLMTWWRYLELDAPVADAFRQWRSEADAGLASYTEVPFVTADLAEPYADWLEADQLPFQIGFTEWLPLGEDRIEGWSEVSSMLRQKVAPGGTFGVRHSTPDGDGLAGVLIAYDDPAHQTAVMVDGLGGVYALRLDGDEVGWHDVGVVDPPGATVGWQLSHEGGAARVEVDGVSFEVDILQAPATGLALYEARVTFEQITPSPW